MRTNLEDRCNASREQLIVEGLFRLSEEAADKLSLPEILGSVCRLTAELVPADRCTVHLWNDRRSAFIPAADHGSPPRVVRRFANRRPDPGPGFVGDLIAGKTIVASRDDPGSPELARAIVDTELYAFASVPLRRRRTTVGWLTVGVDEPPGLSAGSLEVALALARQAASLIDTARLFMKVQRAAAFRAGVAELSAALNAWNDRVVIARLVCKRGAELFKVSNGFVFRREGESLSVIGASGPGAERAAKLAFPVDDESIPVVRAFREARPVFVNDMTPGPRDRDVRAREMGLSCLVAVPLVGVAGAAGCLVYGDAKRRHAFSQVVADEGIQLASVAAGAFERVASVEAEQARRAAEVRAAELGRRAQESAGAARAKAEFLANMSHEIRTPMTAILGYLNLVSSPDTTDAERQRHLATIRRNGDHLMRILDDILDLSKIEAGKMTVERAACSPVAIANDVASLMRPRATEKRLTFAIEYDGPIPERIVGDVTRLRQILVNLLSNAIKFTESGGVCLRIGLATPRDVEQPMLRFDVVDTGIGLSEDALEKLFAPFTQADASMTRRFGGTGLGLAISRRLAQMLGGDIVARSAPGEGSVFSVTIETGPLDGVAMIEVAAESAVPDELAAPGDLWADPPLRARVLLAEDTVDIQRLLAFYLRKAGADVEVADDGIAARERALVASAAGRPFDVILMDMQMPELDGEQATIQLRQAGYTRPIVALTAHAMPSEREKCLQAGCDDFASKPIEPDELIATIRRHVDGTRSAPQARLVSTLKCDAELTALLGMFIAGLPRRVAAMERALAGGDVRGMLKQAHQLKGTSGGYGFAPLSEAVARLEALARAAAPPDDVRRQLDEVAALCRRACLDDDAKPVHEPIPRGSRRDDGTHIEQPAVL